MHLQALYRVTGGDDHRLSMCTNKYFLKDSELNYSVGGW